MEVQAREKALREQPPAPSARAFPKLTLQSPKHPKVFGPINGPALSYEDRLALCGAVIADPGDGEMMPPKPLDWRKTRAAHELANGRFAIVLTNDFVIEAIPDAPAETEAPKGKKGKAEA